MGWRAPGCPAAWEGDGSDPLWGHQHRGLLAPALTLTFAAVSCPPCPTCSQAEGAGVLGDVQAAAWERRGSAETHPPPPPAVGSFGGLLPSPGTTGSS